MYVAGVFAVAAGTPPPAMMSTLGRMVTFVPSCDATMSIEVLLDPLVRLPP
jgi:hypothetical protein